MGFRNWNYTSTYLPPNSFNLISRVSYVVIIFVLGLPPSWVISYKSSDFFISLWNKTWFKVPLTLVAYSTSHTPTACRDMLSRHQVSWTHCQHNGDDDLLRCSHSLYYFILDIYISSIRVKQLIVPLFSLTYQQPFGSQIASFVMNQGSNYLMGWYHILNACVLIPNFGPEIEFDVQKNNAPSASVQHTTQPPLGFLWLLWSSVDLHIFDCAFQCPIKTCPHNIESSSHWRNSKDDPLTF